MTLSDPLDYEMYFRHLGVQMKPESRDLGQVRFVLLRHSIWL